jgi:hypothetical protein
MSQQPTSRESYRMLNRHVTQEQRAKILSYLVDWPALRFSDRDISRATGLAINIVESRRNDLAKIGLIEAAGTMRDPQTKRWVNVWKAKKP